MHLRSQKSFSFKRVDCKGFSVFENVINNNGIISAIKVDGGADLSGNKISSDIEDLIIHMKRSPKVIGNIKKWSPDSLLVGFKLLSGVPHEELIAVGTRLMEKNDCDFVLAHDQQEIGADFHKGYLIHKDGSCDTMETNEEIADRIAQRVMTACRERSK